ncbi:hypothetical protein PF005_g20567 [Phytophthora fragariae]|uniref:FYVE-type domain-containing protein n=6 Tax=Phytophthora fragariae TaxID=53985 RepID=A0A6A4CPL4_9STRA|nr:hypothetical protein PF003_g6412 [Phytophthora fragariae]KAE8928242.1 hypothetical protein PF009_g21608 [Phytophthora fragariae]KAE8988023.1 hypothetical protein PF011_g19333 [Phytophthora fragariae]KAE9086788.1 hypothetical protein PF007_g20634 [Phytophthora fragariae]KAE9088157.1 hypothetical protein PF010_g19467 [Phytophthora fragariae]
MSSADGWTSPTATQDQHWGVSSSAKLLSRPSRHAVDQSATNFEQTLKPFDQTINPFEQTKRPFDQTVRQPQPRPMQPRRQSHEPSRQSRPMPQPVPNHRATSLGRSMGPSHQAPRTRTASEQHARRQSQQIPERPVDFGRSVGPSRPVPSHQMNNAQQRISSFERSFRGAKPIPNHRTGSLPMQHPPRPSQQIPMGFPHLERHRSDKSASGGGNSSTNTESYVELSPARRCELVCRLNESVQHVMASMLTDQPSNAQWKPKLRKKDVSYYMDEASVKPGQTRFCCVSHTHATVAEVMKLFVLSDTASVARSNRVLSDSLLEARVVSVLRRPTTERPMSSMYVRYSSYQAPGLMVNRDVCVAVATDMIRQPDGSTIGYCLWDSVDDAEFVGAAKKPGLEPFTMFRSGFFLRRSSDQSHTKIVYLVGLEPGGWAPGFTARLLMDKFGSNLSRICSHFRRKRLDSRTFVMKTQWASKLSAKSCKDCAKPFQVLSSRVNCHACGHVVCRSCASKESVELHAVGLVPMHICFSCLESAGLPAPASSPNARSSLRRRRLQSDSAALTRAAAAQTQSEALSQSQPQIKSVDLVEEDEEDDDADTGEWSFTPSGVPVRPYRMAAPTTK